MYTGVSREARRAPPEDGDVEDVPLVDRGGSSGSDEDVEAPSAGQRGWPSTSGIDGTSWGDRTGRKDASSSSSATLSTDGPAKGGCAGAEAALPVAWRGRRRADDVLTLHEASASVPVSLGGGLWKQLRGYLGIGVVVSVGYMDPGNWASDLGSGSRFGYALLFVVLLSSLAAMVSLALAPLLSAVYLCTVPNLQLVDGGRPHANLSVSPAAAPAPGAQGWRRGRARPGTRVPGRLRHCGIPGHVG